MKKTLRQRAEKHGTDAATLIIVTLTYERNQEVINTLFQLSGQELYDEVKNRCENLIKLQIELNMELGLDHYTSDIKYISRFIGKQSPNEAIKDYLTRKEQRGEKQDDIENAGKRLRTRAANAIKTPAIIKKLQEFLTDRLTTELVEIIDNKINPPPLKIGESPQPPVPRSYLLNLPKRAFFAAKGLIDYYRGESSVTKMLLNNTTPLLMTSIYLYCLYHIHTGWDNMLRPSTEIAPMPFNFEESFWNAVSLASNQINCGALIDYIDGVSYYSYETITLIANIGHAAKPLIQRGLSSLFGTDTETEPTPEPDESQQLPGPDY